MERNESNEYYTIDLPHIMKTVWQKAWILVLSGILAAAIGFSWSAFFISPQYSSSILLYVNNSSLSLGNTSFDISASDISASLSLVKTHSVILKNRTTLERIIEKTAVPYTPAQLATMIEATSAEGTEIMKVTVTSTDPYEAADIANCIAEVLPARITEIIDGASMVVVDYAIPVLEKVSPSVMKYTVVGMLIGVLLAAVAVVLAALMDDTIRSEDYILQNYDYPILAKIPDLLEANTGHYGKYYKKSDSKTYK